MDFRLSDEQAFVQDTIRKFVARDCPRETARALDEQARFPTELLQKLAVTGLCALTVPEDFGGGGRDLVGAVIVIEELASVAPVLAGAFARLALVGGVAIADLGTEGQKARWLPEIATGRLLFTTAIAEPDDDRSDVRATRATEGDTLCLDGTRPFVPLARQAHYFLTLARTVPGPAAANKLSLLAVDAAAPGLAITDVEKIGLRGAGLGRLTFTDVRVPAEAVLGGPAGLDRGREQARHLRALEQLEAAAMALGIAQGAFRYAANYARERVQFGQPIVSFEAIQHMFVEMAVELQASRLLLHHASWLASQKQPFALEAGLAQAHTVEFARKAALQCLHILGGYGFMMEYDAQRYVRDALSLLSGSEPVEVLKSSLGVLLGLGAAG
jgi:alkylation response protein AidB-like acyl-CoA dehydrogenase